MGIIMTLSVQNLFNWLREKTTCTGLAQGRRPYSGEPATNYRKGKSIKIFIHIMNYCVITTDITFYFRFCKIKSVLSVRPLMVFNFCYFLGL